MILLDTNVLSELAKPKPSPRMIAWLKANEPLLALPAIALAEVRYGIARLPQGRRRASLMGFWEATCEQFRGRIVSFDEGAALAFGDAAAKAEKNGKRLKLADAQIAGIAIAHRMKIATRNTGDFEASGAPLVNPWE